MRTKPPGRSAPVARRNKGAPPRVRPRRVTSLVERHRAVLVIGALAATLTASAVWTTTHRLVGWLVASNDVASPAVAERLLLKIGEESTGRGGAERLVADLPVADLPVVLRPPAEVRRAITEAARVVGADEGYLLAVAAKESRFDPAARAEESSAAGLYQFTEGTWLRVVKLFGGRHGLGEHASRVVIDGESGAVSVAGAAARARLLKLREDPRLSALMAAELGRDNCERLERLLGRGVTPTEIYLAHFLGVAPAARLIEAARSRPYVAAARLLPAAAESNPAVFRPGGEAASAGALVARITAYFAREVPRLARI